METETLTLTAEISKPRKVTWYKNGEEIKPDDRFQISTDETKMKHMLTITDMTMDENALFSMKVEEKTTTCTVTVTGGWSYN